MKKLLHFIENILGLYRWHPTIALRYLPLVRVIKESGLEESDILEVGSGGLGIAPYIKRSVVGVDVGFFPPVFPELVGVKASATALPFTDNSFSVVISTDMLEHLNKIDRSKAISEIIRVSKKLVLIGVPSGEMAQIQDEELSKSYKKTRREEFAFFSEHAQFGLPAKEELFDTIRDEARKLEKKVEIKNFATLNLKLRKILMHGWISENILVNFLFRKVFLMLIPVLLTLNQPPCYRQHFVVAIHHV